MADSATWSGSISSSTAKNGSVTGSAIWSVSRPKSGITIISQSILGGTTTVETQSIAESGIIAETGTTIRGGTKAVITANSEGIRGGGTIDSEDTASRPSITENGRMANVHRGDVAWGITWNEWMAGSTTDSGSETRGITESEGSSMAGGII